MDKQKSILNVSVSLLFKILTLLTALLTKRLLIRICGNDVNGLNALYLSIIGFLAVSELGVGTAISFCMYRPIVEGDTGKVSALYRLFRRLYAVIGGVILLLGLAVMPLLPQLARDYTAAQGSLWLTFLLMLLSVVITYWFGAKTALINAYKNNYITTAITSGGMVLQNLLQIAALLVTGSFFWYLVCRIVSAVIQWALTEWVCRRKHRAVLTQRQALDAQTKQELSKNIRAMFLHKIGTVLVHTTDSILISAFLGVAALGVFSNYNMILAAVTGILVLIFQSLTSVIGHAYAEKSGAEMQMHYERFQLLNFCIGAVFYLGYYAVIDALIALLFSDQLLQARPVTLVIAFNGFVQFQRQNTLVFRDATGTFYHDRWKAFVEGIVNLLLSLALAKPFGVAGIIGATAITNLLICHTVEPLVLYRHAFRSSVRAHYLRNYGMILLFAAALLALHPLMRQPENPWIALTVNGGISLAVSLAACAAALLMNRGLLPKRRAH